jgi:hypothetical protein
VKAIATIPRNHPIDAPVHEFDFTSAADMLHRQAALRGANAVEQVEFLRIEPSFWTLQPTHRIIAHHPAERHRDRTEQAADSQRVSPFIADFLSDDLPRIAQRKAAISEEEWERTLRLGHEYLSTHGEHARDGELLRCAIPAKLPSVG